MTLSSDSENSALSLQSLGKLEFQCYKKREKERENCGSQEKMSLTNDKKIEVLEPVAERVVRLEKWLLVLEAYRG